MSGILLICLFLATDKYVARCTQLLPEVLLLLMGICFIGCCYLLCRRLDLTAPHAKGRLLAAVSIVLLAGQLLALRSYYFYSGWDVQTIVWSSNAVAHGEDTSYWSDYFSTYPNNLFIVYIFAAIRKVFHLLGLHIYEYVALLLVQCVLNTLTGVFLARVLDKLTGNFFLTALGYLLYLGLVGISPWVSIPYSDSMGLLFPILMLDIYLERERAKHPFWPWLGITVLAVLGYYIKPQLLICWIAIVLVELVQLLRGVDKKQLLQQISAIFLGLVCATLIAQAATASLPIAIDSDQEFQMPHFLMMGLNPDGKGVYTDKDVAFSHSFATVEARNAADWAQAKEYIQRMGAAGLIKQLICKTLINYNDGSFFWGREGGFFLTMVERDDSLLSQWTQSLFYIKDATPDNSHYGLWLNFAQMLWLTTLLLTIFSIWGPRRRETTAVMLTLLGLTLFETIFEARSRYLYAYVPLYIVLAICGVQAILSWRVRKNS
jgi:hypothetical protein